MAAVGRDPGRDRSHAGPWRNWRRFERPAILRQLPVRLVRAGPTRHQPRDRYQSGTDQSVVAAVSNPRRRLAGGDGAADGAGAGRILQDIAAAGGSGSSGPPTRWRDAGRYPRQRGWRRDRAAGGGPGGPPADAEEAG